jgi:hypothetical protein
MRDRGVFRCGQVATASPTSSRRLEQGIDGRRFIDSFCNPERREGIGEVADRHGGHGLNVLRDVAKATLIGRARKSQPAERAERAWRQEIARWDSVSKSISDGPPG